MAQLITGDIESYYRYKSPSPLVDLFSEGNEWRATCPFCHHPGQKFYIQQSTGKWYCHIPDCVGHAGGNIVAFHALLKGITKEDARQEIYYDEKPNLNSPEGFIAKQIWSDFHQTLMINDTILEMVVNNWKITQDAVEHFKLGYDISSHAVTFPVFNKAGKCINLRYKKLGTPPGYDGPKVWNHKDKTSIKYGSPKLYPEILLDTEDELFWVCGEKDMVSTWSQGITNVITCTSGEGTWLDEWSFELAGKTVHFIPDTDGVGLAAGKNHIYEHLKNICNVNFIVLPKMPDYQDGTVRKDITDYWLLGRTANDLLKLIPNGDSHSSWTSGPVTVTRYSLPTLFNDSDRERLEKDGAKSIVDDYIENASTYSNSPVSYHRLCGLWTLSNLLGKNVSSTLGRSSVFPNLFAILVGPTTTVRKSSATSFARNVLTDILSDAVALTSFTPEGLLSKLQARDGQQLTNAIYWDEIAQLFDQIRTREFMQTARDLLIRLFDNEKVIYDKSKESTVIENAFLTMVGSAVPTRLAELLSWRDIESGFLIRFLIAYESQGNGFTPRSYESDQQKAEYNRLVQRLRRIKNRWNTPWKIPLDNGSDEEGNPKPPYLSPTTFKEKTYNFRMRDEVLTRFNKFEETCSSGDELSRYEHVAMVHARLPMLLQKLAVIYAAADPNTETFWNNAYIQMRHLLLAIRDLDSYRRHMVDLVLQVGSSEIEHFVVEIFTFIFKRKRVTRTEIAAKIKTDKLMLDKVLDTMKDRGMVIERRVTENLTEYMCAN